MESSLQIIHDISTENIGTLCISKLYSPLKISLNTQQYDGARQKSDLASAVLQEMGFNRHSGEFELDKHNHQVFRLINTTYQWLCLNKLIGNFSHPLNELSNDKEFILVCLHLLMPHSTT